MNKLAIAAAAALVLGFVAAAGAGFASTSGLRVATAEGETTRSIELRLRQRVWAETTLYITAREAGSSWGLFEEARLSLDEVSETGRYRYNDVTIDVPLRHGTAAQLTLDLRVWQDVWDAQNTHVSVRPRGGLWKALGTLPVPIAEQESPESYDRYGNTLVEVPVPADAVTARDACENGAAVPDPEANPGLVDDCTILLEARDVLAGAGEPPNWSANRLINHWRRVSVRGTPPRVTGLEAGHRDFSGNIPASPGRLSMLTALYLRDNDLTGGIPAELASLANLEYLNLGDNDLTGQIPTGLGTLANLRALDLSDNDLEGEIPPELGALTDLWTLDLRNNALTGGIPQELSSLRNLESLSLESNRLSGDLLADMGHRVDAGHFENLRGLGLGLQGNRLTGCIPLSLRGILGATTQLELPYCECPASSPGGRAGLPNLGTDADGVMLLPFETLDLPAGRYRVGTSLAVDLPQEGRFWVAEPWDGDSTSPISIIETDSHSYLVLDPVTGAEGARGTVDGPSGCTRPSDLFDQIVASTTVEEPERLDPDGIPRMGLNEIVEGGRSYRLDTGHRWWPPFVIDIPEGMRLSLVLVSCILDICGEGLVLADEATSSTLRLGEFTGEEIGRSITDAGEAIGVDALFDRIVASVREDPAPRSCGSDPISPDCTLLLEMKEALAGDAELNWGVGVMDWEGVGLSRWTGRVVGLGLEGLAGAIPAALGQLTELEYLRLNEGQLTGEIPRELGALINLRSLNLSDNELTGGIPPELGLLARLGLLNLSRNQLSGGLPPELGSLVNLRYLRLSGNQLTGEIPLEFGSLLFLIDLTLDREAISGVIPTGLGRLSYLVDFSFP